MILKTIYESFSNLLFPPTCAGCGNRLLDQEKHICLSCFFSLPIIYPHITQRNELEDKLIGYFQFVQARAFCNFEHGNSLQQIVHSIKYDKNKQLAIYAGELCAKHLVNENFFKDIDYLVPIPLHPKREQQRGFNQATEICKGISLITKIPIYEEAFKRIINNSSQTKLKKENRKNNVKNIFVCHTPSTLVGKHILLVDDIITTGATMAALISSIPANISLKISVVALGNARL